MVYCKCGFIDLAIFDMNSKKGDLNCKNPQNPTTGKRYLGWKQDTGTDNPDTEVGRGKAEHTKKQEISHS